MMPACLSIYSTDNLLEKRKLRLIIKEKERNRGPSRFLWCDLASRNQTIYGVWYGTGYWYPVTHYTVPTVVFSSVGTVFIWYGSGSRLLAWIPIRIQGFDDQKTMKKLTAKKTNLDQYYNLPIPRPPQKNGPSCRKSLQPSKKKHSTLGTPGSRSGFWMRIRTRLHWPHCIRIQSGSGSETLVGSKAV
jgi:hypothetical protein